MRIALLFLLVLCGGCWSLPEGKPPAGEIVRQTAKDTLSPKAAEERLITALTMFTMTELPGQSIAIEAPETMLPLMKNVMQIECKDGCVILTDLMERQVAIEGTLESANLVDGFVIVRETKN